MLGNALSTAAHAKERTHVPGLAGRRPQLRVLDDDRPIEHVEHGAEEQATRAHASDALRPIHAEREPDEKIRPRRRRRFRLDRGRAPRRRRGREGGPRVHQVQSIAGGQARAMGLTGWCCRGVRRAAQRGPCSVGRSSSATAGAAAARERRLSSGGAPVGPSLALPHATLANRMESAQFFPPTPALRVNRVVSSSEAAALHGCASLSLSSPVQRRTTHGAAGARRSRPGSPASSQAQASRSCGRSRGLFAS
jgi:hypothetical protein